MATFSFQCVKIVTSGDGGVITTTNEDIYKKLKKQVEHQALHAFKQCKNIDQFVKKAYEENQKKEISPELQIGLEKALPISLINSFAIMRKKEM